MPVKLLTSHKAYSEMSAEVSAVYQQLTVDLAKAHRDFKSREKRNEKDKLIHGSVSDQKQAELEGAKRLFEKLFAAVSGLADATGGEMPVLRVREIMTLMDQRICTLITLSLFFLFFYSFFSLSIFYSLFLTVFFSLFPSIASHPNIHIPSHTPHISTGGQR